MTKESTGCEVLFFDRFSIFVFHRSSKRLTHGFLEFGVIAFSVHFVELGFLYELNETDFMLGGMTKFFIVIC